jgi:hypothetical protein
MINKLNIKPDCNHMRYKETVVLCDINEKPCLIYDDLECTILEKVQLPRDTKHTYPSASPHALWVFLNLI